MDDRGPGAPFCFKMSRDEADPIEVGGETAYEVHVVNEELKASGNVRLSIALPPELKPVAAEGPTRHTLEGELAWSSTAWPNWPRRPTRRIGCGSVKALKPGDLRSPHANC